MELMYMVTEKCGQDDQQLPTLHDNIGVCSISCKNIAAFTRTTSRQDNYRHLVPIYSVCVSDLNTPYESHVILESPCSITHIEFSNDGMQLLIVRSDGYVFQMIKGAAIHDWKTNHTANWCGEEILLVKYFHQGVRTILHPGEIKVSAPYQEKITSLQHKPTLTDHGHCAMCGFFAVTASGLMLICILSHEGQIFDERRVVLGQTRDNLTLACASLSSTGHIHIATWKPALIKCWRIEIKLSLENNHDVGQKSTLLKGGTKINIAAGQSFCPSHATGQVWQNQTKSEGTVQISCMRYLETEDPNNLIIALSIENENISQPGSMPTTAHLVQRYQLQEVQRPPLNLFKSSIDSTTVTSKEWVCVGEWLSGSKVVELGTTLRHLLPPGHLPAIVTAATVDANIHSINRDTMQQVSVYNLHGSRGDDMPPSKRVSLDRRIISLCHTWSGFSVMALDRSGSLYFISLMRPTDMGPTLAVSIILLLEYALVSGNDWWDLLISTQSSSVLTLTDRLCETFFHHSSPIIQHLQTRFYVMKTSMLRLLSSLQQRATEARVQTQLTAELQLFRSLRPVTYDIGSADKNISNSIQAFIENRASLEQLDLEKAIDQLCCSLNLKDCQVDPGLLQNLQPLLQFAADLSLFLLFMLAQNSKFELARDPKIVANLRELLFLSRLWYRQNKFIVPQMLKKTESVDVWAQMYKLLTRLAQIIPGELDSSFIDDCVLLETQVVCRELPLYIPPRGFLAVIFSSSPTPMHYEFGFDEQKPSNMSGNIGVVLEGALPPLYPMDHLNYHFLGTNEAQLQCTRCWSVRGNLCGDGDSLWDQQWSSTCMCSGFWAQNKLCASKAA